MKLQELRDLPATMTVPEAGRLLGLGRQSSYAAAEAGQLPAIRIGHKWIVPTAKLLVLLGVEPSSDV